MPALKFALLYFDKYVIEYFRKENGTGMCDRKKAFLGSSTHISLFRRDCPQNASGDYLGVIEPRRIDRKYL